jgi:hypothetical protein
VPSGSRARKGQTRTQNPGFPLIATLESGVCSKRLLCSGACDVIGDRELLALIRSRQARFGPPQASTSSSGVSSRRTVAICGFWARPDATDIIRG